MPIKCKECGKKIKTNEPMLVIKIALDRVTQATSKYHTDCYETLRDREGQRLLKAQRQAIDYLKDLIKEMCPYQVMQGCGTLEQCKKCPHYHGKGGEYDFETKP